MVSLRLVVLHVALRSIFVELNDLSKLAVQTSPLTSCRHMPGEKAYMALLRAIKNKNDLDNRLDPNITISCISLLNLTTCPTTTCLPQHSCVTQERPLWGLCSPTISPSCCWLSSSILFLFLVRRLHFYGPRGGGTGLW